MRAPSGWLGVPKALVVVLLSLAIGGCSSGDGLTDSEEGESIREFLVQVALASGLQATFVPGDPPSAGSGPSNQVAVSGALIPGGSQIATVTSGSTFDEVIVALQGESGYYRVTLPTSTTSAALALTVDESPPSTSFNLQIGASSGGSLGSYQTQPVALAMVGTGEVQVSVSWDALSDVDLHVVDPNGEEIYYGNPFSDSGGELDLDANAACGIDSPVVNQENITWETAPSGTYVVRVNYWSDCGVAETNYVVTVREAGEAPRTYSGRFAGPGNGGGLGSGTTITTFTH